MWRGDRRFGVVCCRPFRLAVSQLTNRDFLASHEQVALVVSDFDPLHGTLTINKARVGGIDKDSTKTGEDRLIRLCTRALQVLPASVSS
jgi:hypothetical protein